MTLLEVLEHIPDPAAAAARALRAARSFLELDVLDRWSEMFLDTPSRQRLLAGLPVASVPVLADFVADYRARVRVVYVEAPAQRILDRGRAQAVPAHVIDRLVRRWTVPTPREAHTLLLAVEPPDAAAR